MIEQHERQTLRPGAPRPECNLSQNRPERLEARGPHLLLANLIAHRIREGSILFNHGSAPPRTIRRIENQGTTGLAVRAITHAPLCLGAQPNWRGRSNLADQFLRRGQDQINLA